MDILDKRKMLDEFEGIIGTETYSVFLNILEEIGPDARTHRISVVIAAMMQFALNVLLTDYQDGLLARALMVLSEEPHLALEGSEEAEVLYDFIDKLCDAAGMLNERESARGTQYSIAENAIAEYAGWYAMPWEDY